MGLRGFSLGPTGVQAIALYDLYNKDDESFLLLPAIWELGERRKMTIPGDRVVALGAEALFPVDGSHD